jgi:hypothetical protein
MTNESPNEQIGTSAETLDPDILAQELGRHMLDAGCQFIRDTPALSTPLIVALSVYEVTREDGPAYAIRYDFMGGGDTALDRLYSTIRLLREAHAVAVDQLRREELAAVPITEPLTKFN